MPDAKSKIISSKPVFKAKLFEVEEDVIQYPSGDRVTHHVVQRHPTIDVFPITPDNEVYLIKQYRYLLEGTLIEAIAGFIDPGETPLEAAKRELHEEAGITARHWEEIARLELSASVIHAQARVFLARDLEIGEAAPEEGEEIELIKLPLADAIQKITTGEITSSSTIAGLLLLEKLLKTSNK